MSLYAIGDLHLCLGAYKPMDVFGGRWEGYMDKLREGLSVIQPGDTTVLLGDLSWALGIEQAINRSPYGDLLRVPGIGVKSARRILAARRSTKLTFQDLKKLGVVLKRAVYFITCSGRMMYPTKLEEDYIVRNLTDPKDRIRFGSDGMSYRQMTLFDDGMFPNGVRQEEKLII